MSTTIHCRITPTKKTRNVPVTETYRERIVNEREDRMTRKMYPVDKAKQYRDVARELISLCGGRPAEEQVADMARAARLNPDELNDVVWKMLEHEGRVV